MVIPLKSLKGLEGKKAMIRIIDVEGIDDVKLYSYIRLLRESEDARELFEI